MSSFFALCSVVFGIWLIFNGAWIIGLIFIFLVPPMIT